MNASKFFTDNITRLSAQTDPVTWNLNQGLLALAQEVARLQSSMDDQKRRIEQLSSYVHTLPTR